ncbi:MAG: peptidylprolyl isomerase [Clostridia bacterium]|nr:peptidylprolyl isomerase [Clostridia bacterium]
MGKQKLKTLLIALCVILAAALVIGLNVYNKLGDNGTLLRSKTAAESENFEVSGTMMAYFYNSNYSTYAQYLSMLGADTTKSLKAQTCPYVENGTWFDYFVAMTVDYVGELLAICEAANAAGLSTADVDQTEIDSTIEMLKAMAESYGYSLDQYLTVSIGTGMNEKDVRNCLELTALASLYSNQFMEGLSYTAEEKEAYYKEHAADFDGVDYLVYKVSAFDYMEKDVEGNPIGDTSGASASAKEAADKIAAAKSADDFKALVREHLAAIGNDEAAIDAAVEACYHRHETAASIAAVSEWAFSASAGDIHMTGVEGDTSFTVYYLLKPSYRDETANRNVRHILFSTDQYTDGTKAEEVLAEWEAAGYSDEKFAELVAAYSADTGSLGTDGVYENVAQGQMTNTFNAWLFDADRKAGDRGIVESDYGWHIMEYMGQGEGTAWEVNAEGALSNADYEAMITEHGDTIEFDLDVINEINA